MKELKIRILQYLDRESATAFRWGGWGRVPAEIALAMKCPVGDVENAVLEMHQEETVVVTTATQSNSVVVTNVEITRFGYEVVQQAA